VKNKNSDDDEHVERRADHGNSKDKEKLFDASQNMAHAAEGGAAAAALALFFGLVRDELSSLAS
jgi:hypothetical protein